ASLNLGLRSGDEAGNVLENRRRFFSSLGIETDHVALSHQVHGDQILLAGTPGNYEGYDALITGRPGLFVAVSVADCVPVLVYDARQRAAAAVHAGWRGTVANIVTKTLQRMAERLGTRPVDCHAYVGTCIDECSFEVDRDVADAFDAPFKRWDEARQKYFIDLKAANAAQLRQFGIPDAQIGISPYSTVRHNEDYFSYRKEGSRSGRMLAVIGVRE
ncbi:MAG: peptidoglycan editing factor PgeF, partial [Ferruginibacter sp.]|nr:peptidoglycan editing factor PgeF [Cytophagales bacterium]